MRKYLFFTVLLTICLLAFSGCSCDHIWTEADCLNAKTCSNCLETDGDPLGHDWSAATCQTAKTCSRCAITEGNTLGHIPGEWNENIDMVTCAGTREQHCSVCNKLIASETISLSTLVQNDLFLFTPREFMERLTLIAEQHSNKFTYEFVNSSIGLQVLADIDGMQTIIQFFHSNATALASDEIDAPTVWCVSLITIGESDADFRQHFFMACDPKLDKDAAYNLDIELIVTLIDATSNGEPYGFLLENHLLYESSHIPEGTMWQDYSMSMFNIYASDYR